MTLEFGGRSIVLDVEGTTSSIAFVYDVLFPYARNYAREYLVEHWDEPELDALCKQIAIDAGTLDAGLVDDDQAVDKTVASIAKLMDRDSKTTALKELQGRIWKRGFESGELQAHVFDDVPDALVQWAKAGLETRIYSSGSVAAQILFFGHTAFGSLLPLLRGHFDTTIGSKREAPSYAAIASTMNQPPEQILFLSDVAAELDAARSAGMHTGLVVRPGNPEQPNAQGHPVIKSLVEVRIVTPSNSH